MRLVHYSATPFGRFPAPHLLGPRGPLRPLGLWVSDDDCEPGPQTLPYVYDVALFDGANVLKLSTATELDLFTREFQHFWSFIDWLAVETRWDGLIISPCIQERCYRPETAWYYAWGGAGGYIFRPDPIRSMTLRTAA
jgi:hypothetical protein